MHPSFRRSSTQSSAGTESRATPWFDITTRSSVNKPLGLQLVLGSERLTGAALDRLTHRSPDETTLLETKGESDRLQDATRRRKPS